MEDESVTRECRRCGERFPGPQAWRRRWNHERYCRNRPYNVRRVRNGGPSTSRHVDAEIDTMAGARSFDQGRQNSPGSHVVFQESPASPSGEDCGSLLSGSGLNQDEQSPPPRDLDPVSLLDVLNGDPFLPAWGPDPHLDAILDMDIFASPAARRRRGEELALFGIAMVPLVQRERFVELASARFLEMDRDFLEGYYNGLISSGAYARAAVNTPIWIDSD